MSVTTAPPCKTKLSLVIPKHECSFVSKLPDGRLENVTDRKEWIHGKNLASLTQPTSNKLLEKKATVTCMASTAKELLQLKQSDRLESKNQSLLNSSRLVNSTLLTSSLLNPSRLQSCTILPATRSHAIVASLPLLSKQNMVKAAREDNTSPTLISCAKNETEAYGMCKKKPIKKATTKKMVHKHVCGKLHSMVLHTSKTKQEAVSSKVSETSMKTNSPHLSQKFCLPSYKFKGDELDFLHKPLFTPLEDVMQQRVTDVNTVKVKSPSVSSVVVL
jgi:hypothetical protein